jgi:hypothetical protein
MTMATKMIKSREVESYKKELIAILEDQIESIAMDMDSEDEWDELDMANMTGWVSAYTVLVEKLKSGEV